VALGLALQRLVPAYFTRGALGAAGLHDLEDLLRRCFDRFCLRLAWLGQLPETMEADLCNVLPGLLGLVEQGHDWIDPELFATTLLGLEPDVINPKVDGMVAAILMLTNHHVRGQTSQRLRRALGRASLAGEAVGRFMEGFLTLGRARLLQEPDLVALVTDEILEWDEIEFLDALPSMRLAFAQLSPHQIRQLGELVGAGGSSLTAPTLDVESLERAAELRQAVESKACAWGLSA
jgi:hypothetical protein